MLLANAVQLMVSQCRSPKRALIRCRELCVPAVAFPPGGILLTLPPPSPNTVTPKGDDIAVPWKLTVVPGACAGANSMNAVGLVIPLPRRRAYRKAIGNLATRKSILASAATSTLSRVKTIRRRCHSNKSGSRFRSGAGCSSPLLIWRALPYSCTWDTPST
jgi:hypothetical protein